MSLRPQDIYIHMKRSFAKTDKRHLKKSVCVCMRACVRERARERERESVCVYEIFLRITEFSKSLSVSGLTLCLVGARA